MKRIVKIKEYFVLVENNTPIKVITQEELNELLQKQKEELKAKIRKYTLLKLAREIEYTALLIITTNSKSEKKELEDLQKLHFEEILRRQQ